MSTIAAPAAGAAVLSEARGDMRHVVARLERLPYCSWHLKMRLIICTAWFFDAFDSIAIAYVLPPLIGLWHLSPQQIGSLIGIGFLGQLVGAVAFGWIAEYWGRRRAMLATLLIFSLGALACAGAQSYIMLSALRFIQGIGLGGEIPLMAAYVNEFAHAKGRGRFSISIQVLFSVGLLAVALVGVYVVPHWGWQWMFVIGAIPALIAIPMRVVLPESPRWLASRGRYDDADRALTGIEQIAARDGKQVAALPADLPTVVEAKPRITDLFKGIYRRRTIAVWLMWIGAYFVSYGITAWMPSLFRTVYHLNVQQALSYGLINSGVGLAGALAALYLIEAIGRRRMFVVSLGGCAAALLSFAFLPQLSAAATLMVTSVGFFFLSPTLLSLATYTAEIYPTHLRTLGGGVASAWQRGASVVGTTIVGWVLPYYGINAVFVMFGLFALMGAIVAASFAVETRAQVLERLSPVLVDEEQAAIADGADERKDAKSDDKGFVATAMQSKAGVEAKSRDGSVKGEGNAMAKGFGIAALVLAILAIFIPLYGLWVAAIASVFAVISALAGDRIFATAAPIITAVNLMFLSPAFWHIMNNSSDKTVNYVIICVLVGVPFVAMYLNQSGTFKISNKV